jgi:single-strand DNA-binding protein
MSSINSVLLLGNVGSMEVKEFGEGKFLVQVSVATTSGYKKKDGEYENITEWHRCIFAIPSLAERAKNIKVGDTIEVRGSIKTNKWTDKESGDERSSKEISATYYTTHKKAANQSSGAKEPESQDAKSEAAPDDLPFG